MMQAPESYGRGDGPAVRVPGGFGRADRRHAAQRLGARGYRTAARPVRSGAHRLRARCAWPRPAARGGASGLARRAHPYSIYGLPVPARWLLAAGALPDIFRRRDTPAGRRRTLPGAPAGFGRCGAAARAPDSPLGLAETPPGRASGPAMTPPPRWPDGRRPAWSPTCRPRGLRHRPLRPARLRPGSGGAERGCGARKIPRSDNGRNSKCRARAYGTGGASRRTAPESRCCAFCS